MHTRQYVLKNEIKNIFNVRDFGVFDGKSMHSIQFVLCWIKKKFFIFLFDIIVADAEISNMCLPIK